MANWKAIGGSVAVVAAVAAAGAGWWAYDTLETSRSDVADDRVTLADFKADPEAVARGEYVMRTGDCAACHTKGMGDFAGGYEIATPFGVLVSSNITPDATGIGAMTERDFFNALRQGIGQHGLLYPAMPYTAYKNLTDGDMHDLWAYMSTVPPVRNDIDETAGMRFPFNIRLAMAGWDMLFFENTGFDGDPVADRGRYIVDGGGHCSACHSPRNLLSAEVSSKYLQGGSLGTSYAPEITSNEYLGVGGQSVESIAQYLRTGTDGVAVAAGPMAEAVEHSLQYLSDEDLTAMATYLKSVPGSDAVAPPPLAADSLKQGALEYEISCSACHGPRGEGMGLLAPAFAGNAAMLAPDITNLSHALMVGGRASSTHENPTGAGMPSFAWKYTDAQMAEILDYVRNSWGNAAPPVKVEDIAKMRADSGARDKLSIPQ
ncbi:cytochrome c [Falsirhodobacter sp. 20TX0035]|uniref:cytochrome c n=1 Tax=Falsirhodobacter sp. 20TX0035 TaxID=3022019 RepID=UPI00232EC69F|nr:cytochrome c [Falsirhodobacter sp. 20TX0035]MDB6452734.1 cytochrome c [Falsirhodobacter sp. 20TX0035]